jgi:hypothetical protein
MEAVAEYVSYVRGVADDYPSSQLYVEQKLDMRHFIPDGFGTGDAVIVVPFDRVIVIDAKFGTGVRVRADSLQLAIYGMGAVNAYEAAEFCETVECVIVQPGLNHVDSHSYTREELAERQAFVATQAQEAFGDFGVFKTGAHCKFCLAKPCEEMKRQALQAAKRTFAPTNTDELAEQMQLVPVLEAYVKAIKEAVAETLNKGGKVAGFKLVEGRRSRSWGDEEAVEKYLRSHKVKVADMFNTALKSPAQMEKSLKGSDVSLDDYIEVKTGKPTVVPEDDKRKAITSAELVFENQFLK